MDILGRKAFLTRPKKVIVEGKEVHGSFDNETYCIEVEKDLISHRLAQCVGHESGHGIINRLNIDLNEEVEEILVESFAHHFIENIHAYLKLIEIKK